MKLALSILLLLTLSLSLGAQQALIGPVFAPSATASTATSNIFTSQTGELDVISISHFSANITTLVMASGVTCNLIPRNTVVHNVL